MGGGEGGREEGEEEGKMSQRVHKIGLMTEEEVGVGGMGLTELQREANETSVSLVR